MRTAQATPPTGKLPGKWIGAPSAEKRPSVCVMISGPRMVVRRSMLATQFVLPTGGDMIG
jgi:hypothetical protein